MAYSFNLLTYSLDVWEEQQFGVCGDQVCEALLVLVAIQNSIWSLVWGSQPLRIVKVSEFITFGGKMLLPLSLRYLMTPIRTHGWWWELKWMYLSVLVGFQYNAVMSWILCLCKCTKERDLPLRLFFNSELYCSILCVQVIVEVLKDKKLHLSPWSPAPLQLYGLLKVHKSNTPLKTFGDRLPNKPVVQRILTPIPALLSRILWILLNIYMYITQFWRRWQDGKFQCCEPFTKVLKL